jgi:iron(III) transport system ATP-binding protein
MTMGVTVTALTKRYGSTPAVNSIDLNVEPGTFVTLLGPSGCGKTTTLRMIAGLEEPDGGQIGIGDREVFGPGRNVPVHDRRLGMVFQGYAVWPHMTVADNVRFPLRMQKRPRREQDATVAETLERVGLAEYAKRYPSELSGGQQQRVALGRAIASNPAVILYDEPLSNLDAALREQMRFELRTLHQRLGTTAIYVTHDQQEALVLSDQICLMNQGNVVQVGSPRDDYERPVDRFASDFLGTANLWRVRSVLGADADRPGGTPVELESGHPLVIGDPGSGTSIADAACVTIRPHQIELRVAEDPSVPATEANTFRAVIRDASYLGDRMRYVVTVSDSFVMVVEENPVHHGTRAVGSEVEAVLPWRYCLPVR